MPTVLLERVYDDLKLMYPKVPFKFGYYEKFKRNVIILTKDDYQMKIYKAGTYELAFGVKKREGIHGIPFGNKDHEYAFIEKELRELGLTK